LASTRALQEEFFRRSFPITDPDELADYVTTNYTALVVELGEFMQEVGWKDWATPRGWVNRRQAVGELVDAGHFLANLLCALDVTDAEWEEAYRAKQEVNRRRQREGYDGVSGKCPVCRRAYDDADVSCTRATDVDPPYCDDVAG
jgi:dimeric dUTPase (all-alpha-NTP-PPase superfamily)